MTEADTDGTTVERDHRRASGDPRAPLSRGAHGRLAPPHRVRALRRPGRPLPARLRPGPRALRSTRPPRGRGGHVLPARRRRHRRRTRAARRLPRRLRARPRQRSTTPSRAPPAAPTPPTCSRRAPPAPTSRRWRRCCPATGSTPTWGGCCWSARHPTRCTPAGSPPTAVRSSRRSSRRPSTRSTEAGADLTPQAYAVARDRFVTTSRYEWMFWDAAWRQERWPIA